MMNDNHSTEETKVSGKKGFSIVDFLEVLLRWRKFIVVNFLVVTLSALIISFILPQWYKSTASILPPKDQGIMNIFGISASALKSLPLGQKLTGLGQKPGVYNYLAILNSRSAMESVVRKFDLSAVYEISDSSMEKTIKELEGRVSFEIQDEENITVEVIDRDQQRAADIANYFVEVLNSLSIQLSTQEAKSNREFIEKRLADSRKELRTTEDALKAYQEKSGLMILPDQNSGSISSIAELYGLRAKKEVELAILKRRATGNNSLVQQAEVELGELNRKLASFPLQGLESIRLYRDVVVAQKIVEFLVPLYEQARIDEQKDVPVLLVLDKAIPAEKKFKPKRAIIVLTAAGLSLFCSFLILLGSIYLGNFKREKSMQYERIRTLLSELRRPLKAIRRDR